MIDAVLQVLLFAGSAGAVFLLSSPKTRKIGWWVNLSVEPIWFYTSYQAEQWGIFALAFFYTGCIFRGLYFEYPQCHTFLRKIVTETQRITQRIRGS